MWSNLLLRSCWITAQLLDPYHPWHVMATPTLVKSMCCIFVRCTIDGSSVEGKSRAARINLVHWLKCLAAQDAIIEALTHVDVGGLQDIIERLLDDKHSEFLLMLDSGMWAFIKSLC